MKKYTTNKEVYQQGNIQNQSSQEFWEQLHSSKEWGKYPSEAIIRFIARNFYNAQNRFDIKILELGIGAGANLWFAAREGFCVSGIEWSASGMERFKERLKKENLDKQIGTLKVGDILEKLDEFSSDSFDCWIDSAAFTYNDFDKTSQIIQKATSKLKAGGKFISITPSFNCLGFSKDESLGYHQCRPTMGAFAYTGVVRFCDEDDLQKLYSQKSMQIDNIYTTSIIQDSIKQIELFVIEGTKI